MARNVYEPLKTYFLKVNINCQGCKRTVKKTLGKVEGVYSVDIDTEQQAVMVRGNLDPEILVNKLKRRGKHAEVLFLSPNQYGLEDDKRSSYINIVPRHNLNNEEMLMANYFEMRNSAENFQELFGGGGHNYEEVHPGFSNATGSMKIGDDDVMMMNGRGFHGTPLVPQSMNHQHLSSRPLDGFYY